MSAQSLRSVGDLQYLLSWKNQSLFEFPAVFSHRQKKVAYCLQDCRCNLGEDKTPFLREFLQVLPLSVALDNPQYQLSDCQNILASVLAIILKLSDTDVGIYLGLCKSTVDFLDCWTNFHLKTQLYSQVSSFLPQLFDLK